MSSNNMKMPPKRKQRTIKNSIVDIDDVVIDPGKEFTNWRQIAQQKLKQREIALLQQRRERCNDIIISALSRFVTENETTFHTHIHKPYWKIPINHIGNIMMNNYNQEMQHQLIDPNSEITTQYIACIDDVLRKWNGYKPDTNVVNSFREYFQRSRRYFDVKKVSTFAAVFCIPIRNLIEKFSKSVAAHIFRGPPSDLHQACANYLSICVSKGLFEGQIQPPNTRLRFLIPAMAYTTFLKQNKAYLKGRKNQGIRKEYLQLVCRKMVQYQRVFEAKLETFMLINTGDSVAPIATYSPEMNRRFAVAASPFTKQCPCAYHLKFVGDSQQVGSNSSSTNKRKSDPSNTAENNSIPMDDWTQELNDPYALFQSPSPPYVHYIVIIQNMVKESINMN